MSDAIQNNSEKVSGNVTDMSRRAHEYLDKHHPMEAAANLQSYVFTMMYAEKNHDPLTAKAAAAEIEKQGAGEVIKDKHGNPTAFKLSGGLDLDGNEKSVTVDLKHKTVDGLTKDTIDTRWQEERHADSIKGSLKDYRGTRTNAANATAGNDLISELGAMKADHTSLTGVANMIGSEAHVTHASDGSIQAITFHAPGKKDVVLDAKKATVDGMNGESLTLKGQAQDYYDHMRKDIAAGPSRPVAHGELSRLIDLTRVPSAKPFAEAVVTELANHGALITRNLAGDVTKIQLVPEQRIGRRF